MKNLRKTKVFWRFPKSYFFIMFLHIFFRDAWFSPKNASKTMISEPTWLPCGVKVAPRGTHGRSRWPSWGRCQRTWEGLGGSSGIPGALLAPRGVTFEPQDLNFQNFWSSQALFRLYLWLIFNEKTQNNWGFSMLAQNPTFSNILFTWSFRDLAFH